MQELRCKAAFATRSSAAKRHAECLKLLAAKLSPLPNSSALVKQAAEWQSNQQTSTGAKLGLADPQQQMQSQSNRERCPTRRGDEQ